jgi:uncharacterized protein YjbJ (UPF0337 family)
MNTFDNMQGKVEELKGKVTDDKKTELKGKVRQVTADTKDEIQRITDKLHQRM